MIDGAASASMLGTILSSAMTNLCQWTLLASHQGNCAGKSLKRVAH